MHGWQNLCNEGKRKDEIYAVKKGTIYVVMVGERAKSIQ